MDEARRQELLRIARSSIEVAFEGKALQVLPTDERYGAFVTLNKNGELCGCIGYLVPISPLNEQIALLAREAAFGDYRFSPLTKEELPLCTIEISIMSEPVTIASYEEFIPKKHGIIITLDEHRAVFLPQVADETGWNREEMLSALAQKAGLPPDAWKRPEASFEIFTAEVFSE